MNTQNELTRIQTARNKLRTKGVELGINTGTDKLDVIAAAFEGIENRGAVTAQVQEGESYTIARGYHNGSGTVSGVKGGGNYSLQSKKATPTKKQQSITPDSGYYGLSDVTVAAIPDNFQDVTPVTAGAADVLANKVIVSATGETVAGTMPNNGKVTKTLAAGESVPIAKGYHDGTGSVSAKDLASQTDGTATEDDILTGKTAWVDGVKVTGTIPVWNDTDLDGLQLPAGQGFTYDAGYHRYDTTIYAQDLASQTPGDAVADNLIEGKKAWVNGEEITGTIGVREPITAFLTTKRTFTSLPRGFYDGSGSVVAKTDYEVATPTKEKQTIKGAEDALLTYVEVNPIPDQYQDVTGVTATAADVLKGKVIVDAEGNEITGTMPNIGAQTGSLNAGGSVTISKGYHDGTGKITGNSLASQTPGDAAAANILTGKKAWVAGSQVTGTMPNNGVTGGTIDGLTTMSLTIPAGYTTGGTVSLTSDIEEALAAI